MSEKIVFTWDEMSDIARTLAQQISDECYGYNFLTFTKGGLISSYLVSTYLSWVPQVVSLSKYDLMSNLAHRKFPLPSGAYVVLDDILDTGKTVLSLEKVVDQHYCFDIMRKRFFFLIDKAGAKREITGFTNFNYGKRIMGNPWVEFPWDALERNAETCQSLTASS